MLIGASCFDCGWGGIQIQTYNHIKYSKYDYVLFADSPGSMWEAFSLLPNVKHVIFTGDSNIKKFASDLRVDAFIHHTINHIARDSIKDLYALGIPVVVFHHCSFKPIYDSKYADEIITTSDKNIEIIKGNATFTHRKIHKLHLSLDFSVFDSVIEEDRVVSSKIIIGRFGRLEPVKQPDKFIEAAYHLSKKFAIAEFVIGGALSIFQKQDYLSKLNDQIQLLGLADKVRFTGNTTEIAKIRTINNFDIFLYPTSFEGYCMSFIEAMYLKKPVVTFDNFANKETVGSGGVVVADGDVSSLVTETSKLIKDSKLGREIGEDGHKLVKERNNVHNFAACIDTILSKFEKPAGTKQALTTVEYSEAVPKIKINEKYNICIGGWGLVDNMVSTPEYLHLKHLRSNGHNIDFFCVTPVGCSKVGDVPVNRVSVFDPSLLKYIPDVVHIHHTENPLSMSMAQWAKSKGIPVVMNIHSITNPIVGYTDVVNHFVVFSDKEKDYRLGNIPEGRMTIIPNGVDPFDYIEGKNIFAKKGTDVLFVGQFFEWKGIYTFVDVAKQVLAADSSYTFHMATHIIGEHDKLKAYIGKYPIKLYPSKHSDRKFIDLVNLYHSCDIFYLPTKVDCFPTTIIEAMMCGKPVVATTVGGISSQIDHGVTGYHVSHIEKHTVRESVSRILSLKDYSNRESMGSAGKLKAMDTFNIHKTIDSYVELYYDLINKRCRL